MSTERQDDALAIIDDKKRRLTLLKLRAARDGYDTPPQVSMEIEDLESEISKLEGDTSAVIAGMGSPAPLLTGISSATPSPPAGESMGAVESPAPLHSRNAFFSGREDLLRRVRQAFVIPGRAGLPNIQVLSGLGGVGKTQTALEYAYRHQAEYAHIFWVNADKDLSISTGLAVAGHRLGLPEASWPDRTAIVAAVTKWLATNSRWLLVLDNADAPDLVRPLLVGNPDGHFLLTSRASVFDALGVSAPFVVGVMDEEEAVQFLLLRTGREGAEGDELAAARRISREMGCLPLALEQAGAYVSSRQAPFTHYLTAFVARRLKVLERARPETGDYSETVATTWSLNIEAVTQESQAAAEVLEYSAFLNPDAIPFELFVKGSEELSGAVGETLRDFYESHDQTLVDELLMPLTRYSLIEKDQARLNYSIHRLVQEVVRDSVEVRATLLRGRLIKALCFAFPVVKFEFWPLCGRLLPHAIAVLAAAREEELSNEEAGTLLHRAAHYLEETGDYQLSLSVYHKASAVRERVLGEKDATFGMTLNNMGLVLCKLGRFPQAEEVLRRAQAIRSGALGQDHVDVAQSWNNLGLTLLELGRLDEGEACYRKAQAIWERAGPEFEHAKATCLNNIAGLAQRRGRSEEAERIMRQVLEIRRRVLGEHHPAVAQTLNNLAVFAGERGSVDEGLELVRSAAQIQMSTVGELHPDYAQSLLILGNLLTEKKEFEAAVAAYTQAGNAFAALLGGDNPAIGRVYVNLGHCHSQNGDEDEAIRVYIKAVSLFNATIGPDHIDTASAMNNLAWCFMMKGEGANAKRLYTRVLEIRRRVLGEAHNDVAVVLANLAIIEDRLGECNESVKLCEQAYAIYEKLGFPQIRDCQSFLSNFSDLLRRLGKGEEADAVAARTVSATSTRELSAVPNPY